MEIKADYNMFSYIQRARLARELEEVACEEDPREETKLNLLLFICVPYFRLELH